MSTVLVRYRVKAGREAENVALVEAVYAELAEKKPEGLRYMTVVGDDGRTFFHLAEISSEKNPLLETDAFRAFQRGIRERCDEPPQPLPVSPVGAYGF